MIVLCWEVVPFSEGPLSEVPLYVSRVNDKLLTSHCYLAGMVSTGKLNP